MKYSTAHATHTTHEVQYLVRVYLKRVLQTHGHRLVPLPLSFPATITIGIGITLTIVIPTIDQLLLVTTPHIMILLA